MAPLPVVATEAEISFSRLNVFGVCLLFDSSADKANADHVVINGVSYDSMWNPIWAVGSMAELFSTDESGSSSKSSIRRVFYLSKEYLAKKAKPLAPVADTKASEEVSGF